MSKTVVIESTFVTRMMTADKLTQLGKWIKSAGYDVLCVHWDEHSGPIYQKAGLPFLGLTIEKEPCDVIGSAQKLLTEMDRQVADYNGVFAPTWGELLAYDDFLGTCQAYKIGGADALRPDLVIVPTPGAESNTPEDSVLSLAMWRFCQQNHIPRLGIEAFSLQNDARLNKWPVDLLLTKDDPRTQPHVDELAPQAMRMCSSLRYVMSIAQSPLLDNFVAVGEPEMRKQFGPPGTRFLYLPFHISFKSSIIDMLEAMTPHIQPLVEANFKLLFSCDSNGYRRTITERDMITVGLRRWLDKWPGRWLLVEGVPYVMLALLSDALLAPYNSNLCEEVQRWGVPVIRPGEEEKLGGLACGISLSEAVAWMLDSRTVGPSDSQTVGQEAA